MRHNAQRGFTLVEVVVASIILSMIMLATVTAMRTFGRTYDRLLKTTDHSSEMREVARFLRMTLRDALPEPTVFYGEQGVLEWVTPLDRVGSAGGLQHLRLTRSGDGLVLSFAPYDPFLAGEYSPVWGEFVDDFILIEGLEGIRMSYLSSPMGGWEDRFNGAESPTIPAAVRIDIAVEQGDWPPIVVDLPASAG